MKIQDKLYSAWFGI